MSLKEHCAVKWFSSHSPHSPLIAILSKFNKFLFRIQSRCHSHVSLKNFLNENETIFSEISNLRKMFLEYQLVDKRRSRIFNYYRACT